MLLFPQMCGTNFGGEVLPLKDQKLFMNHHLTVLECGKGTVHANLKTVMLGTTPCIRRVIKCKLCHDSLYCATTLCFQHQHAPTVPFQRSQEDRFLVEV